MDDIYDPKFVKGVFDRCSDRYITFSLICSLGFTERWRAQCVAAMPAPPADDAKGYDLMAGTGEVWPHLLKRLTASRPSPRSTSPPAQHARLAALIARVLKPGGVFSMIEASDPKGWWLRPLYLFHLKVVLSLVERTLLRGAQDFSIGTYSTNFGDAAELAAMLRSHGLEVEYTKYFFGCATGVAGRRFVIAALTLPTTLALMCPIRFEWPSSP
jgi:ubiquinone/menaquinone biosynthesis C-methylase UbiE